MIPIGNANRHLDDLGYSVNVEIYENLVCVAMWKSLTYIGIMSIYSMTTCAFEQ